MSTVDESAASEARGRRRHRLKKHEVYQPNFTLLEELVPEGLLSKAKAIVTTTQKGHKAALRSLRSIEFHEGMRKEHAQLADYHVEHNKGLLAKLSVAVGDAQPSANEDEAIKKFLFDLNDEVLDKIAMSKNVSTDLSRSEMIEALLLVWHDPVAQAV